MKMTDKLFDYEKTIFLWIPVLIWMFVIFFFSSMPTPTVTNVMWTEFIIKKAAHVIEYFILCSFFYRALLGSGIEIKKTIYFALLLTFIYAATDEFHQSFVPGREPRLWDVLIDSGAGALAILFLTKYLPVSPMPIQKLAKKLIFL